MVYWDDTNSINKHWLIYRIKTSTNQQHTTILPQGESKLRKSFFQKTQNFHSKNWSENEQKILLGLVINSTYSRPKYNKQPWINKWIGPTNFQSRFWSSEKPESYLRKSSRKHTTKTQEKVTHFNQKTTKQTILLQQRNVEIDQP